jgi:methyl-accepting chemotaxis protein
MSFLKNLSMRSKLLLLIFFPYLALTVFVMTSINHNYDVWVGTLQEDELTDLTYHFDGVLDAIVSENEASRLSLQGFDKEKHLIQKRNRTDSAIAGLKDFENTHDFSFMSNSVRQSMQKVQDKLSLLGTKREQISLGVISSEDINNYFESTINDILATISEIANDTTNIFTSRTLYAYLDVMEESLSIEQEKEIVSNGIRSKEFNLDDYIKVKQSISKQDNFRERFLQQAAEEHRDIYANIKGSFLSEIENMRREIKENKEGLATINLENWIQNQEMKISSFDQAKENLLKLVDNYTSNLIQKAKEALITAIGSYLLITLLTVVLTALILNSITCPLSSTVKLAEQVSQGNLQNTAALTERKDEIGLLQKALSKMSENLRNMTKNMQEEIKVLSNSANEITNSVSEISSATTETASAVNETTTTVEELKQTAQVSVNKANDVVGSAEEAIKTLKSSEKALNTTIEDMHHIQERMNTISESIIKLSEHSQVIGEIIDTVNDLAEQSNLLAVNAAIEAAKAGEQGKGFSVVAHEVRSLAEQSKQATIQVHNILKDIQNATSSAVMATEQGTKAVTKGVTQSIETSHSIRSLSEDISKVSDTATQIAISSQQQLIGVDQVTIAMNNIKEASNQHVDYMHKIKDKMLDLNAVGKTLKNFSDQYKI